MGGTRRPALKKGEAGSMREAFMATKLDRRADQYAVISPTTTDSSPTPSISAGNWRATSSSRT